MVVCLQASPGIPELVQYCRSHELLLNGNSVRVATYVSSPDINYTHDINIDLPIGTQLPYHQSQVAFVKVWLQHS